MDLLKLLTEYCSAPPLYRKDGTDFDVLAVYYGSREKFRRDYRLYCHFLEKSGDRMSLDDCADLVQRVLVTLVDDERRDKQGNLKPTLLSTFDPKRGKFLSWVLGIADNVAASAWREDQHEEAMLWKYHQDVTGEVNSSFKYTNRRDDFGNTVTTRNQDGNAINREMVWTGRRPTEEIALANFQRDISSCKLWATPKLSKLSLRERIVVRQFFGQSGNDKERLEDTNRNLSRDGLRIFSSLGAYRNAVMRVREKLRGTFPDTSTTGTIRGDHRFNIVPESPVCPTYDSRPDHWKDAFPFTTCTSRWTSIASPQVAPTQTITKKKIEDLGLWDTALTMRWPGLVEGVHWGWLRVYERPRYPSKRGKFANSIMAINPDGNLDCVRPGVNEKDPNRGGWLRMFALPRDYPKTFLGHLPTGAARLNRLEIYRLEGDKYVLDRVTTPAKYTRKKPI